MGQVYRARDTKLNRDVAIKVLPDLFASDAERLARFTREAQTLASLNHPNIAHIHGLEEAGGMRALVMELVEGDDLSQRIARGAIPLDEALPIARQIAEALEAAHEQGIIHRDLKPANIKVRSDGTVKVLDFGLAKAMESRGVMSARASMSATITTPAMTQAGTILGTAAYMSPEQAKGRTVDRRADVWAFGAVLFEMLTGTRAFAGEGVSETLARVIEREPDWSTLPSKLPPSVRMYLERCLRKDPRQRIRDIGDVRLALEGAFETAAPPPAAARALPTRGGRRAWRIALAVAVGAIIALAIPALRYQRETAPETRLDIVTPATDEPTSFALSPDGRQIVFVASGDGASRLWLRSLATTTAQPLAATEGAAAPFWSPDGRSIGFFASNVMKRLELGGGAPQTLAPAISGQGGAWNADGIIVFSPGWTGPLSRVSARGGPVVAVTTLGPQQQSHRWPQMISEDGKFLFYVQGASDATGIYLGALDGSAPTRLTPADSAGVFLPPGWLLWVRAGALVAQRLDVAKATLTGEPVTVAARVATDAGSFRSAVSVAAHGAVAYRAGAGGQRQLTWFDRSGTSRGTVGDPDGSLDSPRVSPDGRRVAVSRTVQSDVDIWLMDGARASRLTLDGANNWLPVWSPDGARLVFRKSRPGADSLYQKVPSGAGVEERLVSSAIPTSWSPDGRFLLYYTRKPRTSWDLWVVPMSGDRTPSVVLETPFAERWGAFSPDGRWVAYHSNESGRLEIYVRRFLPPGAPGTPAGAAGGQWQVSTAGGIMPVWGPDGKELYYLNPTGAMMATPIAVTGPAVTPGDPVMLFPTRIYGGGVENQQGRQYDIAPDGRFLINTVLDEASAPITLLTNWNPEARK